MATITKIQSYGFTQLTIGEHCTFHERIIHFAEKATAEKISITEELFSSYKAAHTTEQTIVRMQQGYAETQAIAHADSVRDTYLNYTIKLVKDAAKAPLPEQQAAGQLLLPIVKPYSKSAELSYARETADIIGLMSDLDKEELRDAKQKIANLDGALFMLDAANTEFETLLNHRTEEIAKLPTAEEAKAARVETDSIYNEIVEWANGALRFSPTEELTTFVAEANQIIDETRAAYNRRMGIKHSKDEKKKEETNVEQ